MGTQFLLSPLIGFRIRAEPIYLLLDFVCVFLVLIATKNSYESILTTLSKPGGGEFGKYFSLPALDDPRIGKFCDLSFVLFSR